MGRPATESERPQRRRPCVMPGMRPAEPQAAWPLLAPAFRMPLFEPSSVDRDRSTALSVRERGLSAAHLHRADYPARGAAPALYRGSRQHGAKSDLRWVGGQAGARLSARLGMRASGDALLRGLRRAGMDIGSAPLAVIGVDEQRAGRGADQPAQVPQAPDVRSREARFTADPRAESPLTACTQNTPLGKLPALGGFAPPMLVRD